jgi:hypothetical protein
LALCASRQLAARRRTVFTSSGVLHESGYTDAVSLDASLRRHVYDVTLARGTPPAIGELGAMARASQSDVRKGLLQLAAARVLVLQPESGEILMVPPFSAVPTPFLVRTTRHASYANCAWDALGVPVMLEDAAEITTACGCCGESLTLTADGKAPAASRPVANRQEAQFKTHEGCRESASPTPLHSAPTAPAGRGVMHFAVPARHWWDDLVFT